MTPVTEPPRAGYARNPISVLPGPPWSCMSPLVPFQGRAWWTCRPSCSDLPCRSRTNRPADRGPRSRYRMPGRAGVGRQGRGRPWHGSKGFVAGGSGRSWSAPAGGRRVPANFACLVNVPSALSCPTEDCEERGRRRGLRNVAPDVWTGCRPDLPCEFGGPFAAGHVQPDVGPADGGINEPDRMLGQGLDERRCSCRSADRRPRQPVRLVNVPSAQFTGIGSGQGLRVGQLVTKVLGSTDLRLA